jgi:hypothetical protein
MKLSLSEIRKRKVIMNSNESQQLLAHIAELTRLVHQQQEEITELRQLVTNRQQHPTATSLAGRAVPRKSFLKGMAATLLVGTGATAATMLTGEKAAQAKLSVSTHAQIGSIATLQGVAITGAALNPDNRYGLVASAKQTALNLANDLPLESDCGVVGIAASGTGVWGKTTEGWAVRGTVEAGGFAVIGVAATTGTGVAGASDTGIGVSAQSMSGIPLFVQPSAQAPTLPADITSGAIYFDSAGNMYIAQGTIWKKVATV